MPFTVTDLKLPADKLAQMNKALGGDPADEAASKLQDICDEAAADVARLTTGYVLDPTSLNNFTRSLALYRAYGYIGPIPKDVESNYKSASTELEAIATGKRPNLPKAANANLTGRAGTWGSGQAVPGRMPNQFPNQLQPEPLKEPEDPALGTL